MEQRLKLLQVNVVMNSGSTGRIIQDIHSMVVDRGWESYIAYGRGVSSTAEFMRIGTDLDSYCHVLQTRLLDRHGMGSLSSTKKLIETLKIINPNVIHLHNIHGYYLNLKVLFNYLAASKIPVIWTFHDCWPMTGHCTHFDYVRCNKWQTQCFDCPQKNEYPATIFIDRSRKNHLQKKELFTSVNDMTIVSVSNWLKSKVDQSFFKKYPSLVINNGIDTSVFKPVYTNSIRAKYNLQNKIILLGVASDWISKKGFYDFMELSKKLDSKFVIILVGMSEHQINGLPSNIIGLTKTSSIDELVNLYAASDVFLNLSVQETFGLTTVEAMSCGTPVIVYNTTASPELVSEKTGFVVNKGDIDGLITAIDRIILRGKTSFSDDCIKSARARYDKKDRYLEYLSLYKNTISRHFH